MIQKIKLNETKNITSGFDCEISIFRVRTFTKLKDYTRYVVTQISPGNTGEKFLEYESFNNGFDTYIFASILKLCQGKL